MPLKAFFVTEEDCEPCDDAREALREFLDAGEVQEIDPATAVALFPELDTESFVPYCFVASETLGKVFLQAPHVEPQEVPQAEEGHGTG